MTAAELRVIRLAPATGVRAASDTSPSVYRPLLQALPICALILVGMALNNQVLTAAGSVAAFGAAIISPPTGLAVLAFMTPLKSPSVIPAPGFNTLLVCALLLGCVYRLPIDRPRLRPGLAVLLLLAFVAYVGVQQLPALAAGYADVDSRRVGYLFIQLATLAGVALAASFVLKGRPVAPFVVAGVIGAVIGAILAIAVYILPAGSVTNLVDLTDPTARVVGPFGDPNYFGLFLATAIAACLAAIAIARSGTLRLVLLAASAVLGIAFLIAFSRGALVALMAGVLALAFTRGRRAALAAAGLVAVMALVVYPLYFEWRLAADAGLRSAEQVAIALGRSDESRIAAALAGPQMFLTAPLFGIGFGQYPLLSGRFTGYSIESHNWYMNVLAEQGLVGVVLWLPMMGAVALALVRSRHAARAIGLAVFATYAVGSVFLQPPLSVQTSAFTVIVVVAALVGDWSRFDAPSQPPSLVRPAPA
jgi:O-antigen ligase/polysaccharide polymerase Wzy-like membrane protein